jgi:hypothetical protein
LWGPDVLDEKVIDKPGLTQNTLNQVKNMQQNLELGGSNIYFELNRIHFANDQKRRQDKVTSIHDFTEKSPLKSFTLQYDHERQKALEEREQINACPHGFARDQSNQIEKSKKIVEATQVVNKAQSAIRMATKQQVQKSQREQDAHARDKRTQEYREYQEQQRRLKKQQ